MIPGELFLIAMAIYVSWLIRNLYRIGYFALHWKRAADFLGLQYDAASIFWTPRLVGKVGGFRISVEPLQTNLKKTTRFVVEGRANHGLEPPLAHETLESIEFDTPELGRQLRLDTQKRESLRILSEDIRKPIIDIVRTENENVAASRIEHDISGHILDSERLIYEVETLIELARALNLTEWPQERRIAGLAIRHPDRKIRHRMLEHLAAHFAHDPITTKVLKHACSDKDARIRLFAARKLGPNGIDTLRALVTNTEADGTVRGEALSWLSPNIGRPEAIEVVDTALQASHPGLVIAGIRCTVSLRAHELRSRVIARLGASDDRIVIAATDAIRLMNWDDGEEPLLHVLEHGTRQVQAAACRALEQVGSTASLCALRRLRWNLRRNRDTQRAATSASRAVQARMGNHKGSLSMAEPPKVGALAQAPGKG